MGFVRSAPHKSQTELLFKLPNEANFDIAISSGGLETGSRKKLAFSRRRDVEFQNSGGRH